MRLLKKTTLLSASCSLLLVTISAAFHQPEEKDKNRDNSAQELTIQPVQLKSFKARSIGPAVMGGRVSSITLDPEDPFTFYTGLGTGGIMKTSTNGANFDAIFEKEAVSSIGAIAVCPTNPSFVWVGTGEANDRNSSSWGNGVYLSKDGGGTWTNIGLKQSRVIARIVTHPTDTNTAWVAAMGDLWNPGGERGLYKTSDGGKTWNAALRAAGDHDKVGCGDVVLVDSTTLYAALYARQRTSWSFVVGADYTNGKDLGGIFKSMDGGTTWKKLENGLPKRTGRIGLDVYRKNPKIVYAIVQSDEGGTSDIDDVKSKRGGVFRSENAGESWTRVNPLDPRPFYFSQIRIDPTNDQRIYLLGYMLHVSEDGGKTFREDHFDKVHPDCHALTIDPKNPKRILLGTDGGIYQSFSYGHGWDHLSKMAAGEFYRITVDMCTPYRIAGGLQDNNNWVGPSRTNSKEGILNTDWTDIGGGDGFYCVFDPSDSNVVYAESQEGYVHRFNLRTGDVKGLRPEPTEGQPRYRFHWNSPLIGSRHEKGTMFLAGNRIFKLTAKGEEWQLISPDLSTQDPNKTVTVGSGAENYGVVYTLAESPIGPGLLWAGTDDGNLWITTDGGKSWTNLTNNLPKPARGQWMSRVEPSWHDPKVAYLAVDAHRTGNYAPLAYRTGDGGKSWQIITGDLPQGGTVKVIREDIKNPDLLFAGTEFGLFITFDRGNHWIKFGDLPTVTVDDIAIHPREYDLVIATHGRSLFIVDDIQPLEQVTPEIRHKEAFLFPPRPAFGSYLLPGFADWQGNTVFRGSNPPEGVILNYYVSMYTGDPVKITITNPANETVANLSGPGATGFNRISWDLRETKDLLNSYGGEGQKFVRSGEYTVTLNYGKTRQSQKLYVEIARGIETR